MKPIGQERAERLRSPVVSSEGYDEWETASESSTRPPKEDRAELVAVIQNIYCPQLPSRHRCSATLFISELTQVQGVHRTGCRRPRLPPRPPLIIEVLLVALFRTPHMLITNPVRKHPSPPNAPIAGQKTPNPPAVRASPPPEAAGKATSRTARG